MDKKLHSTKTKKALKLSFQVKMVDAAKYPNILKPIKGLPCDSPK